MAKKDSVPANAVRKPTAKKKFSLDDFKKKVGAVDVKSKELIWIPIDQHFRKQQACPVRQEDM